MVMTTSTQVYDPTSHRKESAAETTITQGMTQFRWCLNPLNLSSRKDYKESTITKEEAKEFWRRMNPKRYSIIKHLEKLHPRFLCGRY